MNACVTARAVQQCATEIYQEDRMIKRAVLTVVLMIVVVTAAFPQAKKGGGNPLVGAWKITEVTPANGQKISNPQPGLYIFTATHYSMMAVTGTKPRPK